MDTALFSAVKTRDFRINLHRQYLGLATSLWSHGTEICPTGLYCPCMDPFLCSPTTSFSAIPLAALTALIYLRMKPLKIYGRSFSWPWRMLKASKVWIKEGLGVGHRPSSKVRVHFCICLADFCRARGRSSCLAWLWSPACPGPARVPPGNPAPAQVPPPHRR